MGRGRLGDCGPWIYGADGPTWQFLEDVLFSFMVDDGAAILLGCLPSLVSLVYLGDPTYY